MERLVKFDSFLRPWPKLVVVCNTLVDSFEIFLLSYFEFSFSSNKNQAVFGA